MRSIIKNKRGGYTDLFLFMILAVCIVFISVVMIMIVGKANDRMHSEMDSMMFGDLNGSDAVTNTMGKVANSYNALQWISVMLIVGMMISILIGSFLVTTKPVFFLPYIFIVIIAIIVAVGLSNAYEEVRTNAELSPTFDGFTGSNFILENLPMMIAIIGFTGGIIMFSRLGSKENEGGYYG
jgi:uncharacterized membrane protein YfcA